MDFETVDYAIIRLMSTKIIHILKNDSFDDVFSEFKNSNAEEVIFIFPATSKFGKEESHFQALNYEAQKSGKTITVLASNERVKILAHKYKFQFVQSPKNYTPKSDIGADIKEVEEEMPHDENIHEDWDKEKIPEEEKAEEDLESDDYLPDKRPHDLDEGAEEDEKEHKITAELTASKSLSDIIGPQKGKWVPIKKEKEKQKLLEVRRYDKFFAKPEGKIESIWEKPKPENKRLIKKTVFKKSLIILLSISAVALLLIIYASFGSAQVILKPQTQQLDFQIKVTASSKNAVIDPTFNTIPGEYFVIEERESKTVQTTGQKEVAQKAKGKIVISNGFSSSPQPLVATTRFETPEGFIFRTPKSVMVPGATIENGVQKPGQLEIEVAADQAGGKYNIGPSDFTIPGLKGTPKFDKITAQSKAPMEGGIIGLANVVTEKDLMQTKDEVEGTVFEKIKNNIKKKSSGLVVIDSQEPEIVSEEISHKTGEAATHLTITMTAKLNIVAFNENDIVELINSFIQKTEDLILIKESLKIKYKDPQVNDKNQSITFNLAVNGKAGLKIDEKMLVEKLAGLKEKEIREVIQSIKEIETAKIVLSPFWVNRIPRDPEKIKIKIEYE